MNCNKISLNGIWEMAWCDVGTGNPAIFDKNKTLPYTVPGDVHTPFIDAGIIPEPTYARNSEQCTWLEEQEFWCCRSFVLERSDLRRTMELTFEGLDCTADIYLNGQFVGRHNNAFVEVVYQVSDYLKAGENRLLVRIDQGLHEAKKHDLEKMGMMWNNDQPYRVWMRKPQFVYGWDWTIWLASCGIWKDVYLSGYDCARIDDLYVRTSQAVVREGCDCAIEVLWDATGEYTAHCEILDECGGLIAKSNLSAAQKVWAVTVPQAHLWWCNGMGKPYLYTVRLMLLDDNGNVLDTRSQKFGIRTISLAQPQFDDGETGFTFYLNGEPVFCKGANHVPCDCLPGRISAEKETALVRLAKDENMNMLRVWGGGVYSSEAFMTACDEAGIMVWHDFMYACGYYPVHDPEFAENITEEARKAVVRLRRHTSLIGWAGNNEIQEMYTAQKQWNPDLPWYGGAIYEKILPAVCAELCPELVYQPSSPYGGECQADCRHGDQHIWLLTHVHDHPHYLDLWHFTDFQVKFFSEFGVMGAMTAEMAESCIPPENLQPGDPVWMHHSNFCQDGTLLDAMMRRYFGDRKMDHRQYILYSQVLQAELTRHIYEEFRRRKFTCSGLLFWTLSDSYGIHNWSLIDYSLRRKPVYYALKQAMAPAALTVCGWDVQNNAGERAWRTYWRENPAPLKIWGMNDTLNDICATLQWSLLRVDGAEICGKTANVCIPANASVELADVALDGLVTEPEQTVLRARLYIDGELANETKYFFAPMREMVTRDAKVQTECTAIGDSRFALSLTADRFVWLLHIDEPDGVICGENDFSLWPGETKTVYLKAENGYVPSVSFLK